MIDKSNIPDCHLDLSDLSSEVGGPELSAESQNHDMPVWDKCGSDGSLSL